MEHGIFTPYYCSVNYIMHSPQDNEVNGTYNIAFAFEIYATKYAIQVKKSSESHL